MPRALGSSGGSSHPRRVYLKECGTRSLGLTPQIESHSDTCRKRIEAAMRAHDELEAMIPPQLFHPGRGTKRDAREGRRSDNDGW